MPGQSGAFRPIASFVLHCVAQRPFGLHAFGDGAQHWFPAVHPLRFDLTVPAAHGRSSVWHLPPPCAHAFVPASTGCVPLGTQHLLFGSHSAS